MWALVPVVLFGANVIVASYAATALKVFARQLPGRKEATRLDRAQDALDAAEKLLTKEGDQPSRKDLESAVDGIKQSLMILREQGKHATVANMKARAVTQLAVAYTKLHASMSDTTVDQLVDRFEGSDRRLNYIRTLASRLCEEGNAADAEEMLLEVHACQRDMLGMRHVDTLATLTALTNVLRARGKEAKVEALLQEAAVAERKELELRELKDKKERQSQTPEAHCAISSGRGTEPAVDPKALVSRRAGRIGTCPPATQLASSSAHDTFVPMSGGVGHPPHALPPRAGDTGRTARKTPRLKSELPPDSRPLVAPEEKPPGLVALDRDSASSARTTPDESFKLVKTPDSSRHGTSCSAEGDDEVDIAVPDQGNPFSSSPSVFVDLSDMKAPSNEQLIERLMGLDLDIDRIVAEHALHCAGGDVETAAANLLAASDVEVRHRRVEAGEQAHAEAWHRLLEAMHQADEAQLRADKAEQGMDRRRAAPAGTRDCQSVTPSGATLQLSGPWDDVVLSVPPGAVESDVEISLAIRSDLSFRASKGFIVSPVVECLPSGTQFARPVTIQMPHCSGGPLDALHVWTNSTEDDDMWKEVENVVKRTDNVITFRVNHFCKCVTRETSNPARWRAPHVPVLAVCAGLPSRRTAPRCARSSSSTAATIPASRACRTAHTSTCRLRCTRVQGKTGATWRRR